MVVKVGVPARTLGARPSARLRVRRFIRRIFFILFVLSCSGLVGPEFVVVVCCLLSNRLCKRAFWQDRHPNLLFVLAAPVLAVILYNRKNWETLRGILD